MVSDVLKVPTLQAVPHVASIDCLIKGGASNLVSRNMPNLKMLIIMIY